MMKSSLTHEVLRAMPVPAVILSATAPEFPIEEVTDLWVNLTRMERANSVGNSFQVIFSPDVMSTFQVLKHSFKEVIRHKRAERFPYLPYPISYDHDAKKGSFTATGENIPVLDSSGDVVFIIHKVSNVKCGVTEVCKDSVGDHPDVDLDLRTHNLVDRSDEPLTSSQERQLQLEQRRFIDMFREAPVSMCILKGQDHIFKKTNALYDSLVGGRELLGRTVRECFPEVEDQGFIELLDSVYRTGQTYAAKEKKICLVNSQRKEMTEIYLNFMYQPFRDHLGQVEGIFFFGVDVTEQVLARKKVEESERRYRQIVETAQEGIWLVDKDLRTLFANQKMHEILGYSPEEMADKGMLECVDPSHVSSLETILQAPPDSLLFSFEISFVSKRGTLVWTALNITRILTETGDNNGLLAMVTDITSRKKAEEEMKKLSLIARSTTNAIIITDRDRKIQWVNDAFTRITEYSLGEVVGQTTSFLYGPQSNPERQRLIVERMGRQEPFVCQIIKYKKSGRPFWVEIQGRPVFDENGELNYYFNTETDITDRQKAYEKLVNAERQVRKFARQLNNMLEDERSKIAREIHDEFGQQLMGFKMSLSSLDKLEDLPSQARVIIGGLLEGVESTFHSLRNFSNDLRPGILDTLGLIPSIEWLVRGFEKRSRIACSLDMKVNKQKFPRDLSINFFRICQEALTNIVKHAEATAVSVEITEQGEELFMKISDNGKGMVSEKLENAFSLGLLGMHERARLIGGDLDIHSQLGNGTIIKVIAKILE